MDKIKQHILNMYYDKAFFVGKVFDLLFLNEHSIKDSNTDFLDLYEQQIVKTICETVKAKFYFYGGFEHAERKIAYFSSGENGSIDSISRLEIGMTKFSKKLGHRDFLGSLMSLGVDRSKIGDILIFDDRIVFFTKEEMKNYFIDNLVKAGNVGVKVVESTNPHIDYKQIFEVKRANVASMRLDAVISSCFNVSRDKAIEGIMKGKVKVNAVVATSKSINVKSGDVISFKGYGKLILDDFIGLSKKDRLILSIKIYR